MATAQTILNGVFYVKGAPSGVFTTQGDIVQRG